MSRMLKCPRCKSQQAEKKWGYNPTIGRRFRNKHCYACGHETTKQYYGGYLTQAEYDTETKAMWERITERLKEETP